MNKDFKNKEYREAFVDEFVRAGVAFQVRALRGREGWSQKELGDLSGKPQNVISRIENPDYGKITVSTLLSLAAAFDVGLLIRFISFGDLWNVTRDLSSEALIVNRYMDEPKNSSHFREGTGYEAHRASLPVIYKKRRATISYTALSGATTWPMN